VDASGAEVAAKGVLRQLAIELDMSVLDEIERFAFLAKPKDSRPQIAEAEKSP
jgi:hypothetical protein